MDQIFDTYDIDKNGSLDKEETKKYAVECLGLLGSGDDFSEEAFEEVWKKFD